VTSIVQTSISISTRKITRSEEEPWFHSSLGISDRILDPFQKSYSISTDLIRISRLLNLSSELETSFYLLLLISRILLAEMPHHLGKHHEALDRLHVLLATVDQVIYQ